MALSWSVWLSNGSRCSGVFQCPEGSAHVSCMCPWRNLPFWIIILKICRWLATGQMIADYSLLLPHQIGLFILWPLWSH